MILGPDICVWSSQGGGWVKEEELEGDVWLRNRKGRSGGGGRGEGRGRKMAG